MLLKCLMVFLGSGIGGVFRFFSSVAARKILTASIFGTLFVNILGCFLIGYVAGLTSDKFSNMPDTLKLFLTVGFLGGFTTFSTFNLESFELLKEGKIFYGLLYIITGCILGLLFLYLGYNLAK